MNSALTGTLFSFSIGNVTMRAATLFFVAFTLCLSHASLAGEGDDATEKLITQETVELMRGRNSNAFAAYSTIRQAWTTHRFPKHLRIQPFVMSSKTDLFGSNPRRTPDTVIAFDLSDGPIEELVAVDTKGRFRTFSLDKPIRQPMRPIMNGHAVIYYIVDGVIYAFSGRTGTWDSLKAPHVPDVHWENGVGSPPSIAEHGFDSESTDGIVVTLPQGTATFLPDHGVWKIEFKSDDLSKAVGDEATVASRGQ